MMPVDLVGDIIAELQKRGCDFLDETAANDVIGAVVQPLETFYRAWLIYETEHATKYPGHENVSDARQKLTDAHEAVQAMLSNLGMVLNDA